VPISRLLADFAHTLPEQRPLEPLATHRLLQCSRDAVGHAFFINRQWPRLRCQCVSQHSQCRAVNYLADCRQLQALQMMRRVRPLMKDANSRDAVVGDAEINHMPLDIAAAIARSNMITSRSGLRHFGQDFECRGQQVDVPLRLL
jgi:hypothetical protein